MFSRISVLSLAFFAAAAVEAKPGVINSENGNIDVNSPAGRHLMSHARRVQDNNEYQEYDYANVDTSFLGGYSVKFQGCHHVQQWNPDAQDEDDVRIMTKRLVRFRLCPASDCLSDLTGCTSNYGDYVVDMGTFLSSYMEQQQAYYQNRNGGRDLEERNGFDISNYLECGQFDMRRHLQENDGNYYNQYNNEDLEFYMGPYCADQGGEIHLGLFTDDTCTSFANNGETMYAQATGMTMPYSEQSLVSMSCMSCGGGYNGDGGYQVSEFCSDIYSYSGKCETKMDVYYPNESSCSYIEGIKIIREDGVIRTTATKKSKAAAVCIGIFLTVAVLLAGYVYYLRTKLGRAKINLAAASQTMA